MPTESKWDIIKANQRELKAYNEQMKRWKADVLKFINKPQFGHFEAEQVRQIAEAMKETLVIIDALKKHIVTVRARVC